MKKLIFVMKGLMEHPLAKNNRISVLWRFLKWQITKKSYAKKGGMEYNWIDGRRLLILPGKAAATGNYYLGLLEYPEMAFLLHYSRNTDVFVDGGQMLVFTVFF